MTQDLLKKSLVALLMFKPENACYLVIENHKEEVLGFLLLESEEKRKFVNVMQVWVSYKIRLHQIVDQMFLQAVSWTRGKGKTELRGETTRNVVAYSKLWGVEEAAVIVKLRIENTERILKSRGIRRNRSRKHGIK